MWHTSSGILVYDPKAETIPLGRWWLIVTCCPDLARYYREMLNRFYRGRFRVMRPAWESHISVVRGEEPPNPSTWNARAGEVISFQYSSEVESNGEYFWLSVQCPELHQIRSDLGLPPEPRHGLHLTVARIVDE
jgi:hypothetical protein